MALVALRSLLLASLLVSCAALPASSQGPGPAAAVVRILEDVAGDLQTEANAPAPVPRGSMDLRFLDIAEALDNLTFTVGVSPDTGHSDQGIVEIRFGHGDAQFRLHMEQRNLVGGWWWMFTLYRAEADGESFVAIGEALPRDRTAGTVVVVLEKKDLADRSGVIPYVGRQLTGFWAETMGYSMPVPLYDRMPDQGEGEEFTFTQGEVQAGDVVLWSSSPTRASNGEATTVVFTVSAKHTGPAEARYTFAAAGVPEGWQVVFPQPAPLLRPGETMEFPVLVGLPFRHQHGNVEDLRVTLTALEDEGDRGSVRLSVNYHKVPQPAGHHPTVFLHSATLGDARTGAYEQAGLAVWNRVSMNTLEEFEADDLLSVPGTPVGQNTWTWDSPLDPVLQIGLDFDLTRAGLLDVPFTSRLGIPDAVLGGVLELQWQDEAGEPKALVLADIVADGPQALAADVQTRLSASIAPRAEADLVPYREGANLVLLLTLEGTPAASGETGPEKPWLDPGGFFSLPLFEYSDPVDGLFRSLQGVEVVLDGPAQRQANPGESVRFPLELRFNERADFVVTFAGQGAQHAQVVGASRVKADPQGTPFEVAVTLPAEARDGDLLDILVIVQKANDPDVQGIVRVVPEADTDADHADQAQGAGKAETPDGPALLAAVAALGLAFARRRREG